MKKYILLFLFAICNIAFSTESVRVKVVDEDTKEPIKGAIVDVMFDSILSNGITDKNGIYEISLSSNMVSIYQIIVEANGYVQARLSDYGVGNLIKVRPEFLFELEKTKKIGGFVKNKIGNGVSGAEVAVFLYFTSLPGSPSKSIESKVSTNSDGYWEFNGISKKFKGISLVISEPNMSQISRWIDFGSAEHKRLLNLNYLCSLTNSKQLSGFVFDCNNLPLKDAKVSLGADKNAKIFFSTVSTDSNGFFHFQNVSGQTIRFLHSKPNNVVLTVQRDGFCPNLDIFNINDINDLPIRIKLKKGNQIKGKIVNLNNEPIKDALISANQWRDLNTLEWTAITDSNGDFEWNSAPGDEVKFNYGKKGYFKFNNEPLICTESPYVLYLFDPIKIKGTVVDAATNEYIKKFKVITGFVDNIGEYTFFKDRIFEFENGRYDFVYDTEFDKHIIKVEAKGYQSEVSSIFTVEDVNLVYNFKLQPVNFSLLRIIPNDNKTLENVEAYLITSETTSAVLNGIMADKKNQNILDINGDNFLTIPMLKRRYMVYIQSESGYALLKDFELEKMDSIYLKPWCTIKGVYDCNSTNLKPERLYMSQDHKIEDGKDSVRFNWKANVNPDENGNFEYSKAFEGQIEIRRMVIRDNNMFFLNKHTCIARQNETVKIIFRPSEDNRTYFKMQ